MVTLNVCFQAMLSLCTRGHVAIVYLIWSVFQDGQFFKMVSFSGFIGFIYFFDHFVYTLGAHNVYLSISLPWVNSYTFGILPHFMVNL